MKMSVVGIIENDLVNDFTGSIAKVAKIGYQGIEVGIKTATGIPFPPAEIKQRLADQGLAMINIHMTNGTESLLAGFDQTCQLAHGLGSAYVTVPWGPCDSAEQIKRDAEFYDKLGARYRAEGLILCYHNHDHELRKFDGKYGLDILMENSAPENLKGQFDVGWMHFGCADPAALIRKYAGRVPLLHLKDFARLEPGCETAHGDHEHMIFTEVGTGIVNFDAVIAAAREVGVVWSSVEQDWMRHLTPWESITCSYLNLKARGLLKE